MHYMVNGTTPYPLTSYYSSYAGNPLADFQKNFGDAIKSTQDASISTDKAVQSSVCWLAGKGADCKGGPVPEGPGKGISNAVDTTNKVADNLAHQSYNFQKNTGDFFNSLGGGLGGLGDFVQKNGIYIAAGGGILAIMMIFMMFRR